jgi:hypothetical protein
MRNHLRSWQLSSAKILPLACVLTLMLAADAFSQRRGGGNLTPPSSSDPGVQSTVNRLDMSEREFLMRNRQQGGSNRLVLESQQKLLYAQIKEDFERIQVVNRELVGTISAGAATDYKRVAAQAAEIRKRAARLKANLALPEFENESKQGERSSAASAATDSSQPGLNKSIIMLDHAIESFVYSPLFKHGPDVLYTEHVAKASRDLNRIIEASEQVRKRVGQLDKSTK